MRLSEWPVIGAAREFIRDWRVQRAIQTLDASDLPTAERWLHKIREEAEDAHERRQMIGELFDSLRDRIRGTANELREEESARSDNRIRDLEARIIGPDLPVDVMSVDHDLKTRKAKSMLNLERLELEIQQIPEVNNGQRIAASFLMVISYAGNYLTFQSFLGSDYLGSETLTMAATAGAAAIFTVAECVVLYILAVFFGSRKIGFLKITGFMSALALLAGIILLVLSRTEISAVAAQAPVISVR